MSTGRLILTGLLALALAIGASCTASVSGYNSTSRLTALGWQFYPLAHLQATMPAVFTHTHTPTTHPEG